LDKFLGIDYGGVRIGIAVSDDTKTIAFGREFIPNNKTALNRIKSIVESENISAIIIGYPVNLKGQKTKQTLEVDSFIEELNKIFSSVEIIKWDERFTSKIAQDSMLESGMKKKKRQQKGNIDIISAALMLQSYLDSKK
jgi:putative holliday junction resolvase